MRADDAVERRGHFRIAVIDLGDPGIRLRLLQIGAGIVAIRGGRIEGRLRHRLARHEVALALEVELGLLQRGLGAGFRGLGLVQLQFVGLGLDGEQGGAFLDEGAVGIIDRLQKARDARDQVDLLDGCGVAGRLEIARDRTLHGKRDVDLGRRRRRVGVLLAAGERHQRNAGGCQSRKMPAAGEPFLRRTSRYHCKVLCVQRLRAGSRFHSNIPLRVEPATGP